MEGAFFIWGGRSIPELVEPGPRDRLLASGNDLINVLVSDLRELLLPLNSVVNLVSRGLIPLLSKGFSRVFSSITI